MERAKAGTMCPHCGREPLHQIDARPPFDAYLICGICDSTYNIDVPVEFDPKDRLIVELCAEIERLKDKGKFLLSCNDNKFVVDLFKKFHIKRIEARVTLARKKDVAPRREVLISNYELPKTKAKE